MKKLTVLLILLATQWALATPYESTPIVVEDFFQYIKKQKEGDKESIRVNFEKLEALINKLERHAMSYPVKFDNQTDYLQAQKEAKTMTNVLDALYPFANNQTALTIFLRFNNVSYNLDITPKETMERFDKTAQLLTEIDPKNAFIQYFIGGFKMGAGQSNEAKKHLNKAIELGEYRAYFSLALGGIAENSVEETLRLLTEYLKYYPNDEMANKLAKGLKEGTLEIKKDTGKPANP